MAEGPVAVFLIVMNYCCLSGVQTAFDVDPEWTFFFGLWDCQPGSWPELPPSPPFGPTSGTISTAFNCVATGVLLPIGRMFFNVESGCIEQVESSYPFGTHAVDCQQGIDRILPEEGERLGKICVGAGGHDACYRVTPVKSDYLGRDQSGVLLNRDYHRISSLSEHAGKAPICRFALDPERESVPGRIAAAQVADAVPRHRGRHSASWSVDHELVAASNSLPQEKSLRGHG